MESFSEYDIYNKYMEVLVNRLTHSSMSLEIDLGNVDKPENALKLKDSMDAFKKLMNYVSNKNQLTEELIKDIANIVNESAIYISKDYRTTGDYLADTDISIAHPRMIQENMQNLLVKYYGLWQKLDVFEREARFHIDFILIHPFEDGNGRTSRLILNYNLLNQNKAPVVITDDLLEIYHDFIRRKDYEKLAKLFKVLSIKEQEVIKQFYETYTKTEDELTK